MSRQDEQEELENERLGYRAQRVNGAIEKHWPTILEAAGLAADCYQALQKQRYEEDGEEKRFFTDEQALALVPALLSYLR